MRYLMAILLLTVALLLAACGSNEPAQVESTSAPASEETTSETTETENESSEADEISDEPMEFVADGSNGATLSLQHPSNWLAAGNADDGIILSTSPEANLAADPFPSGQANLSVTIFASEILDAMSIEAGTSTFDVLTAYMDFTGNAEGERLAPPLGEIQERMMADGNGAYASGLSEQIERIEIVMPLGDFYILITGYTASGELADFEETFFTIAESIIYQSGDA